MKKYKLRHGDNIVHDGNTLYRIEALMDLPSGVKKGEIGGYVADERNLSQSGDAWVSEQAKVYETAYVSGDATVEGNAVVHGHANINGSCTISGHAHISGHAFIAGNVEVMDQARIEGNSLIRGQVCVRGNAFLGGDVHVIGQECFGHHAHVQADADYLLMGFFEPGYSMLTAYRTADKGVGISYGMFSGTMDAFLDTIFRQHGNNTLSKVFQVTMRYIQNVFNIKGGCIT